MFETQFHVDDDVVSNDCSACVVEKSSLQVNSSTSAINGTSVVAAKKYGNIFANDLKPKAAMDIAKRVARAQTIEGRTALVRNALIERRDLRAHLIAVLNNYGEKELRFELQALSLKLHEAMPKNNPKTT